MKNLKTFNEFVNENYEINEKAGVVDSKDWKRMQDLYLKKNKGESVAQKITDKNKAIMRFVAGEKIVGTETLDIGKDKYDWTKYSSHFFKYFGQRALSLGATEEEILNIFNSTIIPVDIRNNVDRLKTKEFDNWIVGNISKKIIDGGLDIDFIKHGNALTWEGKDAMRRSGSLWTIGYQTIITLGDGTKHDFQFDAITNENVDNNVVKYVIYSRGSDNIFAPISEKVMGNVEFMKEFFNVIEKL